MKQGYLLLVIMLYCTTSSAMQQRCHALSRRNMALLGLLMVASLTSVEAPQPDVSSIISLTHPPLKNDQFFLDRMLQPLMATSEDTYPQAMIKILGLSLAIATLVTSCFSS